MAPKRKLRPSGEGAGPSRQSKGRELTCSFPENTTDPSTQKMQDAKRAQKIEELHTEIRERNCKIEELYAEIREKQCKIEELQAEVDGSDEKNPSILENSIDEDLTTREPANHGRYELKIINDIKKRVYTGSEVQGQDGKLLKVAICYNGQTITSGSLASAKFEVLVLEGNFSTNEQDSWTSDKFQESLVKFRKEVGTILAHRYISKFSNGVAVLKDLKFKDNSNWAPEKNWRLGIRVLENFHVKIQEAISDPFRVLDRHGKVSEKPDTPLLKDGVECLQKVGNKRASSLKKKKICTVKKFLQRYHKNPTSLLKILGIKSEFDESWKTMIKHAKKCDAGSNLYSYRKKSTVLFFNCVYEVVGAEFGNRYRPFEKLQDSKKILVNKWKEGFYKNIKNKSLKADFKLLSGQPVPIEHNSTGNSIDDDASQHDQAAVLKNRQPADGTHFPDNSAPDIGRYADQDIVSDHNTTQYYHSVPDEIASQVQGNEGTSVVADMTLALKRAAVNENLIDPVEKTCHIMDVSTLRKISEDPHACQDEMIYSNLSPVQQEAEIQEWIDSIINMREADIREMFDFIRSDEQPQVTLARFLLAMRFVAKLRTMSKSHPSKKIPSKWAKARFKIFAISSRGPVAS